MCTRQQLPVTKGSELWGNRHRQVLVSALSTKQTTNTRTKFSLKIIDYQIRWVSKRLSTQVPLSYMEASQVLSSDHHLCPGQIFFLLFNECFTGEKIRSGGAKWADVGLGVLSVWFDIQLLWERFSFFKFGSISLPSPCVFHAF